MDAVEFFKEHGFEVVKNIVNKYTNYSHVTNDARMLIDEVEYKKYAPHFADSLKDTVKIEDLKRLVESHERLSEEYGTLENAKEHLKTIKNVGGWNSVAAIIADVESCQC